MILSTTLKIRSMGPQVTAAILIFILLQKSSIPLQSDRSSPLLSNLVPLLTSLSPKSENRIKSRLPRIQKGSLWTDSVTKITRATFNVIQLGLAHIGSKLLLLKSSFLFILNWILHSMILISISNYYNYTISNFYIIWVGVPSLDLLY